MKKLSSLILVAGLTLTIGSTQKEKHLYQVISSHPHDVEELEGHVETVHQNGRLWIVEVNEAAPAQVYAHLRSISGREKSYLYQNKDAQKKVRISGPSVISSTLAQIDAKLIQKEVEELAAYTTRAAGTAENQEATKKVGLKFQEMGYIVSEVCYRPEVCSIIADKLGSEKGQEVLLVLAHLDSVGKEFAGADDNASGTAVLLEMARVLKDYDNKKTIRFFATNGEELGLLGAEHYVGLLKERGEIEKISLAVNMDMVGYNKNGIVELETNPNLEDLARWYADLATKYTKLKTKITLGAWGSDHVPFLDAGAPALLTIEDWSTKTPCYHLACDQPDTLNYEYAADIGKLNVAAVMTKDLE